jgi:hypothetical protein
MGFRIGYLADHFYPHVKRGAEIETKFIIEEGRRRGHEIIECEGTYVKDVDVYIVGNIVDNFNKGELLSYLSRKPYIKMEHDLRAPFMPFYKMLAEGSIINIFRSPLHASLIEKYSGKYNYFLHANCMPKEFRDLGWTRKPETEILYVGDYAKEKGYREMVEWLERHPECTIWHYGGGFPMKHPRMKEMVQQRHEDMPKVYNLFSVLIFLPNYPQACSRVIAEAYLCRVPKIITNDKDGFTSYGWTSNDYDMVREKLINGPKTWWDRVEQEIGSRY